MPSMIDLQVEFNEKSQKCHQCHQLVTVEEGWLEVQTQAESVGKGGAGAEAEVEAEAEAEVHQNNKVNMYTQNKGLKQLSLFLELYNNN